MLKGISLMLNPLLKWLSMVNATIKIKETIVVKGPLILRDVGLFKVPNLHLEFQPSYTKSASKFTNHYSQKHKR